MDNQPIVMPCDATMGIWGKGFLRAAMYWTPPNAETGYTFATGKRNQNYFIAYKEFYDSQEKKQSIS